MSCTNLLQLDQSGPVEHDRVGIITPAKGVEAQGIQSTPGRLEQLVEVRNDRLIYTPRVPD